MKGKVIITIIILKVHNNKKNNSKGFPLTGTIEEVGKDIERIKQMDVDHIIFAFVGLDIDNVVDTAKQLSRYAR
jgi:hypothetical protein